MLRFLKLSFQGVFEAIIYTLIGAIAVFILNVLFKQSIRKIKDWFENSLIKSNNWFSNYIIRFYSGFKYHKRYHYMLLYPLFLGALSMATVDTVYEISKIHLETMNQLTKQGVEIEAGNYYSVKESVAQNLRFSSKSDLIYSPESYSRIISAIIVFCLLVFTFLFAHLFVYYSAKQKNGDFYKSLEIIRPSITESEYLKFKSDWLLMQNTSDYRTIANSINNKLQEYA